MSEQVGDHEGSAPFKEGTIKYACYEVLKHAGPGGLTVRFGSSGTRANPSPRTPLDKFKKSTSKGVEFSYPSPPSLPSYQVAEIVHHIRDGCLAKLGGATPANTIVGQLSKGTRDVLLPGSTTPKKECILDSHRALEKHPPDLFPTNSSSSSQMPTSPWCARRRTRCAQVHPLPCLAVVAFFFYSRAHPRPLASSIRSRTRN